MVAVATSPIKLPVVARYWSCCNTGQCAVGLIIMATRRIKPRNDKILGGGRASGCRNNFAEVAR